MLDNFLNIWPFTTWGVGLDLIEFFLIKFDILPNETFPAVACFMKLKICQVRLNFALGFGTPSVYLGNHWGWLCFSKYVTDIGKLFHKKHFNFSWMYWPVLWRLLNRTKKVSLVLVALQPAFTYRLQCLAFKHTIV